ncbi:short chain dehydrogenase [Annulohypoxylon truncatum]|uniref:short chain dehydrogenase n=1 Tax=Annulohypoxylon truncatum TaxID=327061 RepID=UPI0020085488|nr:short chain dehydrogenase [Annulohypoxylon truncatum]KAI1210836.1 short chain dehydrogenase [Annulohypoxylon truncatum]
MASKLTLDGGIALVTGAASGIGKETAFAFAEAGAQGVVFADLNDEGGKAVAEESQKYAKHTKFRALAIKVDIANAESVGRLVSSTVKEFGRVDYAVHCAGIEMENYGSFTPALDLDVFSKISDTNITGAVLFVRAVMGAMAQQEPLTLPGTSRHGPRSLGRGSIVLLGSTSSLLGSPGMISYTTAKHAIIGIMRSAAVDALALQSAIRVNAVCPAWVDTRMVRDAVETNSMLKHAIDNITPFKRAASVDEVADYIVFLSSPSASFINGTALPIDAGLSLPAPSFLQ